MADFVKTPFDTCPNFVLSCIKFLLIICKVCLMEWSNNVLYNAIGRIPINNVWLCIGLNKSMQFSWQAAHLKHEDVMAGTLYRTKHMGYHAIWGLNWLTSKWNKNICKWNIKLYYNILHFSRLKLGSFCLAWGTWFGTNEF